MDRWMVAEQAHVPKGAGSGEDRLLIVGDERGVRCAAVIDGATDKSDRTYAGRTGGALAADRVTATLRKLPPTVEPQEVVAAITAELARLRRHWGITADDPLAPSAVAAVVWPRQRLAWRVGDVHLALTAPGRREHHHGDKKIDQVLAETRAAYLHCLLAEDHQVADLAREDPGRALIVPVLRRQSLLANRDDAGPLGYGVLDGRPVPDRFIEVFPLQEDAFEVTAASDGYLSAAEDLALAEHQLAVSLRADPLRIGEHSATKGVIPGAASFDDRTYLRLHRTP